MSQISDLLNTGDELERSAAGVGGEIEILHGRAITDKVAELMEDGQVLHYRDMERLLRAAGYIPHGKSPTNTLIASLSRAQQLTRVRARGGQYRKVAA